MRKLWRSRKALSPVIAAIILIAVTVAVSIAVAAWMGALSFTFMATEQISFTGTTWTEVSGNVTTCHLKVKNSGTSILTIDKVKVNNVEIVPETGWSISDADADETLEANEEVTLDISYGYARGANYAFTVVTAKNNPFGPYTATAPS